MKKLEIVFFAYFTMVRIVCRMSQVCCSTDAAQVCVGEGDGTTTRWELTTFVSVADGDVTVTVPCNLASEFVVGVRFVHFFFWQM